MEKWIFAIGALVCGIFVLYFYIGRTKKYAALLELGVWVFSILYIGLSDFTSHNTYLSIGILLVLIGRLIVLLRKK
ncbi:TPA: hypothetical protein GXZ54_05770 [bacterium]|jgi:hypothetical protein|nr:hypothetical protein [bacterium]